MKATRILVSLVCALVVSCARAEEASAVRRPLALGVSLQPGPATSTNPALAGASSVTFALSGSEGRDVALTAPAASWFGAANLDWSLILSAGAPTNVQVLVFMKDWDYLWYQQLMPGYAVPGTTNRYRVDLSPGALKWEPRGHQAAWNARALIEPREFGLRVFVDNSAGFTGVIERVELGWLPPQPVPPTIRDVRPASQRVACREKFEVTFELPDRYANPFDPDEISVTAAIEMPNGETVTVDGFHTRNYYRMRAATGEEILPQGPPQWKIRYAPIHPGTHHYTLRARDQHGTTIWGPGSFVALHPAQPGFLRVSKADPRFFEFDNGDAFFPLGHNIRSPSDDRLNSQFPWAKRWTEGTAAYARHFAAMHEHGENMAEIWMAAWSMGLEWSPQWRGYHGVGQYNLMHAWELDRVIDEAERNGIYLNVVIHNHGKFTSHLDSEWAHNPFNVKLGGYLERPEQYFTDARARESYRKLMRYIIARWGYSTRVFAWELWSELNLTGPDQSFYRKPECLDWHRFATEAIRSLDPNDHLITTHYSSDYREQNVDILRLPGIAHGSVDAYYNEPRALQIVELLAATAQFNNPFGKPVMVTEFGGAWNAQGLSHLENCLHAGLWASTCIPIAGAPLFWWWGLIEEENYYPEFLAVDRFMKGEDRRDPTLLAVAPVLLLPDEGSDRIRGQTLMNGERALGWLYDSTAFNTSDAAAHPVISNLVVRLNGMSNGLFRVEFWETTAGKPIGRQEVEVKEQVLSVKAPPFARDLAFKVRKR